MVTSSGALEKGTSDEVQLLSGFMGCVLEVTDECRRDQVIGFMDELELHTSAPETGPDNGGNCPWQATGTLDEHEFEHV